MLRQCTFHHTQDNEEITITAIVNTYGTVLRLFAEYYDNGLQKYEVTQAMYDGQWEPFDTEEQKCLLTAIGQLAEHVYYRGSGHLISLSERSGDYRWVWEWSEVVGGWLVWEDNSWKTV